MPGELIHLDDHRPHLSGTALCMGCGVEWEATAPIGVVHLECPGCGRHQGLIKNAVEPCEGQDHFACACGGTLFFALMAGWLLCRACGQVGNPWTRETPA